MHTEPRLSRQLCSIRGCPEYDAAARGSLERKGFISLLWQQGFCLAEEHRGRNFAFEPAMEGPWGHQLFPNQIIALEKWGRVSGQHHRGSWASPQTKKQVFVSSASTLPAPGNTGMAGSERLLGTGRNHPVNGRGEGDWKMRFQLLCFLFFFILGIFPPQKTKTIKILDAQALPVH